MKPGVYFSEKVSQKDVNERLKKRLEQDVVQELESARRWITDPSTPHYVKAAYILATHYRYGLCGTKADPELSRYYYMQAAERGHAGACYELARLHLQGHSFMGIEQDVGSAQKYANKGLKETEEFNTMYYKQSNYRGQLEALCRVIEAVKERNKKEGKSPH